MAGLSGVSGWIVRVDIVPRLSLQTPVTIVLIQRGNNGCHPGVFPDVGLQVNTRYSSSCDNTGILSIQVILASIGDTDPV